MNRLRSSAIVAAALAAGTAAVLVLGSSSGDRSAGTTTARTPPAVVSPRPAAGTTAARTAAAAEPSRPPAGRLPLAAVARPVSAAAPLTVRRAYAGVSCRQANRIGCDRIGLAVWLRRDGFEHVAAHVGDRTIALRRGRDGLWSGHLRDAGLRDGPLRVPASPAGRWIGFDPPTVRAVLDAARADGSRATAVVTTPLRAGWG